MSKHPKQLARVYPTVEETYTTAGLGVLSVPKRSENNWIAQKSHKSHFHLPGKSSPANNSELLYDGSAEARAILGPTFEGDVTEEGAGIRRHALDYLKGKNVNNLSMWTKDFFGIEDTEDTLVLGPEDSAVFVDAMLNPPDPNEAFIKTGKEFLQQLRDKATSVEEVMVPIEPSITA